MKNRLFFLIGLAMFTVAARSQSLSITVDGNPVASGETVTSTSYHEDVGEDYYSIQLAPKVELTSSVAQNVTVELTLLRGTDPFNSMQMCWPSNCQMGQVGHTITSSGDVRAGVPNNLMIDSSWCDIERNTPMQLESKVRAYVTDDKDDFIEFTLVMSYPDVGDSDYVGNVVVDGMSFSVFRSSEEDSLWASFDILTADFSSTQLLIPSTVTFNGAVQVPVKRVGNYAGSGKSIVSIVVPSSIDEIGSGAFSSCSDLINVRFEDASSAVVLNGDDTFQGSPFRNLYLGRNISNGNLISDYGYLQGLTLAGSFDDSAMIRFADCRNLMQIISYKEIPPAIGKLSNDLYSKVYAYVPSQYEAEYSNDEHWTFFSNIIPFEGNLDDYGISLPEPNVTVDIHTILSNPCHVTPEIRAHIIADLDNSGILGFDPSGNVYANNIGECNVIYTLLLNGKSVTCHVTVVQPATGIIINKQSLSLEKGETVRLFANVDPADVTDATVNWSSSNVAVATVAEDGTVTAVGGGSCEVVATTHNGLEAKCQVTVTEMPESIAFESAAADINKGEEITLAVTFTPESATERSLTWTSSDVSVASVSDGVVKGLKAGTAVITATTVNGKTAECTLTVHQSAESITLDVTKAEIETGATLQLTATVGPEDAEDKSVSWTSSDDNVATVSGDGLVTALSGGVVEITATTVNGLKAVSEITVIQLPLAVSINPEEVETILGGSVTLTAQVGPANTADKTVTWTTSDESVAAVASDGTVTAAGLGQAIVTATTVNGLTAECRVTVTGILVESIELDRTAVEAAEGEQFQITATVYPEDATDKTLSWMSSNVGVATVDDNGLVTVKSVGFARITARSTDGSDVKAECELTAVAGIDAIFADGTLWSVYTPDGLLIKADCGLDDLRQLASGLYILRSGTATRKIHLNH